MVFKDAKKMSMQGNTGKLKKAHKTLVIKKSHCYKFLECCWLSSQNSQINKVRLSILRSTGNTENIMKGNIKETTWS